MSVIAALVIGSDGSTRIDGGSRKLSTPIDRERFLAQRRSRACIIIGGNTAATSDYDHSPCPVIVLSHKRPSLLDRNPSAVWWNLTPPEAISNAKEKFGEEIGIEAGPTLLLEFLKLKLIDELHLSVTPIEGGEARIDLHLLLSFFSEIKKSEVNDTVFYQCSIPNGYAQKLERN